MDGCPMEVADLYQLCGYLSAHTSFPVKGTNDSKVILHVTLRATSLLCRHCGYSRASRLVYITKTELSGYLRTCISI